MRHDILLTYVSEAGSGSWSELKDAWAWLTGPSDDPSDKAWIAARDLAALAHIEVSWEGDPAWCAAPPILTLLPRSGGRALLTGARTRHLYFSAANGNDASGALKDAVDELDLWIDTVPASDGPTTLLIACEDERDARRLADLLAIPYTYEVAEQLAGLLPPLAAYTRLWPAADLPRGFDAERFDPDRLAWSETEETAVPGLYRARTYQGHIYAINAVGGWRRAARELAVYEVLRWDGHQVLRYDENRFELTVPVHAALPVLHARAATLCSGRLPRYQYDQRPQLTYANVPWDIAQAIAASLSQTLQER